MRQQIDLDAVRWLGTVIVKSAGNKKIKKPRDLMKLPLIDGESDKAGLNRLVQFLEAEKEKRKAAE